MACVRTIDEIPAGFAAYDKVRRPRGNENTVTSRETGRLSSLLNPDEQDLDKIGKDFAPRTMWLWTKSMPGQCQEAVDLFEEYKKKGEV